MVLKATVHGVLDWSSVAIYHFNAQMVSRSTGASAVAGAAYRSGERLTDERTGEQHDYRQRDDLDGAEILTPRDAPEWAQDRARLWNAVEAAERRKDAQVAREVRVAIPRELRPDDGRTLVRDYAQSAFVDRGMVADIAYHGAQGENPHAHIMLTTRTLTPDGFGPKNRSWNKKEQLASWREDWAAHANRALERHGHVDRIDHRTLAVQRDEALARGDTDRAETLDRDPEIHLGRSAWMALRTARPTSGPGATIRSPTATAIASRNAPTCMTRVAPSRSGFRNSSGSPPRRSRNWCAARTVARSRSPTTISDRADDTATVGPVEGVQRQYAEMEHNTATLQNAQQAAEKAALVAENNYRSLTDKCREEFRVRQQVIEGLKHERTMLLSVAVIAGAVGALGAGLTTQAARWLWDSLTAVLRAGWNSLGT